MNTARANILIVDDQPDNLRTLSAILNEQGFKVRKAVSGAMAIETVRVEPPDLILLDIRMPQMDGYEVCATLKSMPDICEIPVIFLSALDDTADKVKAFRQGGADYITKPFQADEVLVRIGYQLTLQEQKQCLQQEIQERRRAEAMVRHLNSTLERQVQERTAQLQRSLEFESLLKRITDKVRDSLDEQQILQTAVQELASGLQIECCRTEIYNVEFTACTITHEYDRCPFSFIDYVIPINSAGLYHQLLQKQEMQFCERSSPSQSDTHRQSILACPIFDDHGMLGNLWLFKPPEATFDDLEARLVRQVANQCAIAIRQARLYQESQQQVKELQKLNQLKDDFLSTISHELRAPIANIKMVIRLIMNMAGQGKPFLAELAAAHTADSKLGQYLKILQDECERELQLIQDLLDLQHLNAGVYPLEQITLDLKHWLAHILEPFELMTQNQQQVLEVHFDQNLPTLVTDGACLKRILTELLNNACKYTPSQGKITVSASMLNPDESIPSLVVQVVNTGIEIPTEELSRIFDQFYRIPSHDPWKHGGTGLGLALVKRLVEYMSGSIQATSAAEQTCFTVELPMVPAPLSPVQQINRPYCLEQAQAERER